MTTLLISAASVAFFHSLAPDHWLPFAALAKASHWNTKRLIWITTLAGTGHVVSSLVLGFLGIWLGLSLGSLAGLENFRARAGIWLLVGFGVSYGLWGIKHAQHPHPHLSAEEVLKKYAVTRMWILFALVVFGPCEPLIPLIFLALVHGMRAVLGVSLLFSLITIFMIVMQSFLASQGFKLFHGMWMERYAHALSGLAIAVTAFFVLISGI